MDLLELYQTLRPLWIVWFALLFVGIVGWAYWPRRRATFEEHARIPFRED